MIGTVAVSLVIAYVVKVLFLMVRLVQHAPPISADTSGKIWRAFNLGIRQPMPLLPQFWLLAAAVFAVLQWGAKWRH